jgi:hypothetical protein
MRTMATAAGLIDCGIGIAQCGSAYAFRGYGVIECGIEEKIEFLH